MKTTFAILALSIMVSTMNAENPGSESKEVSTASGISLATITGKVFDKLTGETLTGACVYIQELDLAVYTDFDGNFAVKNVKPGSYTIKTKLISYCEFTQKSLTVSTNEVHALNLGLSALTE